MTTSGRALSGDILVVDLNKEEQQISVSSPIRRNRHNARTLLKSGALRVTMIVLSPGGDIAEHQADGPITVQPTQGEVTFRVLGRDYALSPGQLLCLAAGIRHSVHSAGGATFLLTLAHIQPAT